MYEVLNIIRKKKSPLQNKETILKSLQQVSMRELKYLAQLYFTWQKLAYKKAETQQSSGYQGNS